MESSAKLAGKMITPSLPTFLQLYNMLSIYALIKLLRFRNCTGESEQEKPYLSVSDVTSEYNCRNDSESKLEKLRRRLDGLIDKEVECEATFDHTYAAAEVVDCIIYYVTGFMCKKTSEGRFSLSVMQAWPGCS